MRIRSLIGPASAALVVLVLALALANHMVGSSAARATRIVTGRTATVTIKNYAFMPKSITVRTGVRVTWTNHDATAHTATADQGSFDTGTINPGQSKTIDFKKAGTYTYHCAFHAFMTATIKVVG
jgi:plastocyanin